MIAEAIREVSPIADAKQQTLEALETKALPRVMVDEDMILRVLINLLENASKYTQTQGEISIQATQSDGMIMVRVQDNGPGIAPAEQQRIFEKFSRIQRKDRPKGLGLGLAFCRLAVEAHGGRIWVESEPGSGSTFSFTLPAS